MPERPKKCIGKKVILTPKNSMRKVAVPNMLFKETPKRIGDQREIPQKIPNTAPILKT